MSLLALMLLSLAGQAVSGRESPPALAAGVSFERPLTAGQVDAYPITLAAGDYLEVGADQKGINLVLSLLSPQGDRLIEKDHKWRETDKETLVWVAGAAGVYQVEVKPAKSDAAAGRYVLSVDALRAASEKDRHQVEALTLAWRADELGWKGTLAGRAEALPLYEKALIPIRAAGDRKLEARVLDQIGFMYDRRGDLREALGYYGQALPVRREVGDREGEALTLIGMGLTHQQLGEPDEALDYYTQSLAVAEAGGWPWRRIEALNNIGAVYWYRDEYDKALDYYNRARDLAIADKDRSRESSMLHNIGNIYRALGDYERAREQLEMALEIRTSLHEIWKQAVTLHELGNTYLDEKRANEARAHYEKALPLRRQAGDRRGEAYTLDALGVTARMLKENEKALDYTRQAEAIWESVSDKRGRAETHESLGLIHAAMGQTDLARGQFLQSLQLHREVGPGGFAARAMLGLARLERDAGRLQEALPPIEGALSILESIRSKVSSQALRTTFAATKVEYYEFYVDLLMRLHRKEPHGGFDGRALEGSERARARLLLESLGEIGLDLRQGVDAALLAQERSSRQRVNAKDDARARLMSGTPTPQQAARAERELEGALAEYREVLENLRATSPRYAALAHPQPLTLGEIQREILDPNTLLLEISLGETSSHLWAVGRSSLSSHVLPPRPVIEAKARELYALLTARNVEVDAEPAAARAGRIARADSEFAGVAAELSAMLLGPAAGQLRGQRLLVVADGALSYVPFAALPEPEPPGARARSGGEPLIARHEVIHLPSASVLGVMRRELAGRPAAPRAIAVLADPVFERRDPRVAGGGAAPAAAELEQGSDVTRAAADIGVARFRRLRFSRREAEAIAALTPVESRLLATDFDASRAVAMSEDLKGYRFLHFATHGVLDNVHPELSGLVLSLLDREGLPVNGFLRLHEIFNMNLAADLVVVSACRTALGKEVRAEGLIGLTRGFFYAGSPRVVASLWEVQDRATADLMEHFYGGLLGRKQSAASALRAAQVALWKEGRWKSPYYWAGFILQGEWR